MPDDDVEYDNSDIIWNVHMLDLPPELLIEIFLFLVNWKSVISLRLSCRQLDAIYQRVAPLVHLNQRERLTEPLKKFYEFLVRLRLPPSQLRIPPAEGWWNTKPAGYPDDDNDTRFNKTPFALDVMRHLPCIAPFLYIWDNETNIAYGSTVCNYSEPATVNSLTIPFLEYLYKQTSFDDPPPSPSTHTICITVAWEGGGIIFILDTLTGLFYEIGDERDLPFRLPVREFFETRMTMLENCGEVFLPKRNVLVLRRKQHGNWLPWEDDYNSEKMEKEGEPSDVGRWVESEADAQWVRHLHFKHGWPGKDWDKTACLRAIQEYIGRREAEHSRR